MGLVAEELRQFRTKLEGTFASLAQRTARTIVYPNEVLTYMRRLLEAESHLNTISGAVMMYALDESRASVVRAAIARRRREIAADVEDCKRDVLHPEILASVEKRLEPYTRLMGQGGFRSGERASPPHLSNYFPIRVLERSDTPEDAERALDEKFRILQSQNLFLSDLARARAQAELRGISVAVAYIDIDDFKAFNTKHTEPVVDRYMLPPFLRALEAHVFRMGHAYLEGGDECILLLHNTTRDDTIRSLQRLRERIQALKFINSDDKLSVSMGFVLVEPECHLTEAEIRERAAAAKREAKKPPKGRIATFSDPWFEQVESVG